MLTTRTTPLRVTGLAALVGAAALISACGGSGGGATASTHAAHTSAATGPTPVSNTTVAIGAAKGADGTYLTSGGRAVYLWVADSGGTSSCSGSCASAWPPLTTKGAPSAGTGVSAADLGTIARSDGSKQVTYNGHPLYYYAGDAGAGQTNGQGSDSFGARWWLVAPSGNSITASASKGASSGSSGGASGGSSGSGSSGGSSWS